MVTAKVSGLCQLLVANKQLFNGNRGKSGRKFSKIGKASGEQANWNAGLGYIWWNFSAICVGVKYCVLGGAH